MTLSEAIESLAAFASADHLSKYSRYGIIPQKALGVKSPDIQKIAKQIKKDHGLALQLWDSGVHEAKILAGIIADPGLFTKEILEKWVSDIYSWDICDNLGKVFAKLPNSYDQAFQWTSRQEEFVKRQGFVTMVALCIHDKKAPDDKIAAFLPYVEREARDERNFVKKAVNWLLRTIGKRSTYLHPLAIETAKRVLAQNTPSARWIAKDALRELQHDNILQRLKK